MFYSLKEEDVATCNNLGELLRISREGLPTEAALVMGFLSRPSSLRQWSE